MPAKFIIPESGGRMAAPDMNMACSYFPHMEKAVTHMTYLPPLFLGAHRAKSFLLIVFLALHSGQVSANGPDGFVSESPLRRVEYWQLRDLGELSVIDLQHVSSKENVSNLMTKVLRGQDFVQQRDRIVAVRPRIFKSPIQ